MFSSNIVQGSKLYCTHAPRSVRPRLAVNICAAITVDKTDMKQMRKPRQENVGTDFFVDHTCIDCDTCRWISPAFFKRKNGQSAVLAQPQTEDERKEAFQALLSCPTFSIHAEDKEGMHEAEESFPRPVPGTSNVYHCGFHSEKSFGCASYLVTRPEGNVLIDVPRFVPKLLRKIEAMDGAKYIFLTHRDDVSMPLLQAMGGAKYIFLTHRDDVAEHAKWAKALGAERILHTQETNPAQGTDKVEVKLEGEGPWQLPDGSEDFDLVLTPGHTEAHVVAIHKPEKVLFSGDHLAAYVVAEWKAEESPDGGILGISRNFNWWRVDEQVKSVQKLAQYDWIHILPGHGRGGRVADAADRHHQIQLLVEREHARGLNLESDHSAKMPA